MEQKVGIEDQNSNTGIYQNKHKHTQQYKGNTDNILKRQSTSAYQIINKSRMKKYK